MKATSNFILVLTVLGIGLLLASIFVFDYPAFGVAVIGVMIGIFFWGQLRYSSTLKEIEREEADLKTAEDDIDSLSGDGIVAQRIAIVKESIANGISPDTQSLSEVLSARESSKIGKSAGGTVILLGLLGTFFGLTLVIANSGIALKPTNTTAEVIDMILNIFSGMRGVFGTSLSGLVAAIILNASFSLVSGRQMSFMADMEEFTQFKLLPKFKLKGSDSIADAVSSLEKTMEGFSSELKGSVEAQNKAMLDAFSTNIKDVLGEFTTTFGDARDKLNSSLDKSGQELTKVQGELAEKLSEAAKVSQQETLDGIVSSVDKLLLESKQFQENGIKENFDAQKEYFESISETQKGFLSEISTSQKELIGDISTSQKELIGEISTSQKELIGEISTSQKELIGEISTSQKELFGEISTSQKEHWTEVSTEQKQYLGEVVDSQKEFVTALKDKMENFYDKMNDYTTTVNDTLDEVGKENFRKLGDEFSALADIAKNSLENQAQLGQELDSRIQGQLETLEKFTREVSEAGSLMKVNQAEMQSSLEMFNDGIESLLKNFASEQGDEQGQQHFLDKLEGALNSFHERASDALVDNAMQTQEILLEVINKMNEKSINGGGEA